MIAGSIQASGEAVVIIRMRGLVGRVAEFPVVVDTGFNDFLALSSAEVQRLGLAFREEARFALADGSESVARLFVGEVDWFGTWRRILVVEMDGGPLLGMNLLRGCRLTIENIDNGAVTIESIN